MRPIFTMVYADLHTHTRYSDGGTRAKDNVRWAKLMGMDAIAITDHDTMAGYYEAKGAGERFGITVIPGVEVTTHDYHILGYGIDPWNIHLKEMLNEAREGQKDEVREKVAVLNDLGIPITYDDVLKKYSHPEQRIGSINLAITLLENPACKEFVTGSIWNVYTDIIKKQTDYVSKSRIAPEEAVKTLKAAGGYVVFAHPPRDGTGIEDLERMIKAGIDAFEIQPHYLGGSGKQNPEFTYEVVMDYAKKNGIPLTAGSDYHGPVYTGRPLLEKGQFDVEKFW